MDKKIKINKPIPAKLKKAIEDKQEWIKKVQSGKISIPITKQRRIA